jgi:hypothetical protein
MRMMPRFELVAEREAPDFILRDEKGLFGLELVRVFRDVRDGGSPSKTMESRRQSALGRLATLYYATGGKPLLVTALMRGYCLGDLNRLARRLQRRRSPEPWTVSQLAVSKQDIKLYLTSLPDEAGPYGHWRCASSAVGCVRPYCTDVLSRAIEAKASKLPSYRSAVSRVGLLLVADSTSTSGMLRWSPADAHPSHEGFDAIYFYRHPVEAIQLS